MPLHPVELPQSAALLLRIVVLQKKLLKALADPALKANVVGTAWVEGVWSCQDAGWVRKFCRGKKSSIIHPIKSIASTTLAFRQTLYDEFSLQSKVKKIFEEGGDFKSIENIPGIDKTLEPQVKDFFLKFYDLLRESGKNWSGYEFTCRSIVSIRSYKNDFRSESPTNVVCPYCDGEIGTPDLDHYLCKSRFPLLVCSPWNLVPICKSCNGADAKSARPAVTLGAPSSTRDWLHPFFRPASSDVEIQLTGVPKECLPQLSSRVPDEQIRLNNHSMLIRTLGERWREIAASYYRTLVPQVNRKVQSNPNRSMNVLLREKLEDHKEKRGEEASSMIRVAVCQAVLDGRPGYLEEFSQPNPPMLV